MAVLSTAIEAESDHFIHFIQHFTHCLLPLGLRAFIPSCIAEVWSPIHCPSTGRVGVSMCMCVFRCVDRASLCFFLLLPPESLSPPPLYLSSGKANPW